MLTQPKPPSTSWRRCRIDQPRALPQRAVLQHEPILRQVQQQRRLALNPATKGNLPQLPAIILGASRGLSDIATQRSSPPHQDAAIKLSPPRQSKSASRRSRPPAKHVAVGPWSASTTVCARIGRLSPVHPTTLGDDVAWIRKLLPLTGRRKAPPAPADGGSDKETREMIRGRDGKLRPIPRTIQKRGL